MSIRVIDHVWGNSKQQGSALLVLLAIADWARDDGHNAYPTIPMLAEKARLSHRSVQRIIANLEESGELVIQRSTGRGHAHVYSVPMDIKGDTPRITNRYLTVTNRHLTVRGEADLSSDPPPDWFQVLSGLPKFKTSLPDAEAWLSKKGISANLAEATAYGVQDFIAQHKNQGRDPWATFQNWARKDAVSPRSSPPAKIFSVNSTDFVAMKAAQDARKAGGPPV